jgi:hypothetical protein
VDQDENFLDILVPNRRRKRAAKTFVERLLKGLPYVRRAISADPPNHDAAKSRGRGYPALRRPIVQYPGDRPLVYFGYLQAHEDDAQWAARAGRSS